MQRFKFEITGAMPLLMHADNIVLMEEIEEERKRLAESGNKALSKKGDDRSPPWTWHAYVYEDGANFAIPQEVMMACLRGGGARKILKGAKTYKEATQVAIFPSGEHFKFLCRGKQVESGESLRALRADPFHSQVEWARARGFDLFVKRAKIGPAKHVRVRPRFDDWSIVGTLDVDTEVIAPEKLREIFDEAGRCGIGDWRPACKSPGPFGTFTAKVTKA